MANKRTLKKSINLICEELLAECVAASLYDSRQDKENYEALLFSILKMQSNFICRVGHPEPGMAPSLYYKDLREKFSAEVENLVNQINNL